MSNEQLLFLPKGNQIPTTGLLAKTNTHLLHPTKLDHHDVQTVRRDGANWQKWIHLKDNNKAS